MLSSTISNAALFSPVTPLFLTSLTVSLSVSFGSSLTWYSFGSILCVPSGLLRSSGEGNSIISIPPLQNNTRYFMIYFKVMYCLFVGSFMNMAHFVTNACLHNHCCASSSAQIKIKPVKKVSV